MNGKQLIICFTVLALAYNVDAEYNVTAVCSVVRDGTQLGSIESCETYYVCRGGVATQRNCAAGESYDKNSQRCMQSAQVNCYFNKDNPCLNKNKQHVPVIGTCDKWIYCENGVQSGQGSCPENQAFKNGQCIYANCKDNINGNAGYNSICDVMPNGVIFGSTINCAQYQVCVNNNLDGGTCTGALVYNMQANLCDYQKDHMCDRVTGQSIQPDDEKAGPCTAAQEGQMKPNDKQCSSYFLCSNEKWERKSCGNLYWDAVDNKCDSRAQAKTVQTCDRCENANVPFVNKVDNTCMQYQYCEGNTKKSEGKCAVGYYFDEKAQACVKDGTTAKTTYITNNGACSERTCAATYVCKCDGKTDPANCGCGINAGTCAQCGANCDNLACVANDCKVPSFCKVDNGVCTECPGAVCP